MTVCPLNFTPADGARPPRCGEGCAEAENEGDDEDSLKTLDRTKEGRQCRSDAATRKEKKLVDAENAAAKENK